MTILLTGNDLTLAEFERAILKNEPVALADDARKRIEAARAVIDRIAESDETAYWLSKTPYERLQAAELMRQYADNDEIVVGAQSGSERMLDTCRRSHDTASVIRAATSIQPRGLSIASTDRSS